MAFPRTPLSAIEEWKRKIESINTDDPALVALMKEGLSTMEVFLKPDSTYDDQTRALAHFDCERIVSLHFAPAQNDANRDLVLGFAECLHLTLHDLMRGRNLPNPTDGVNDRSIIVPSNFDGDESNNESNQISGLDRLIKQEEPFDELYAALNRNSSSQEMVPPNCTDEEIIGEECAEGGMCDGRQFTIHKLEFD
ncbi:hypothetical protein PENTCL1PPCAC_19881 [Pristionchus entomophagus]|uniref:Uncharacterized protein n=1 Tax=Pristionchus entomophagus TaxID=358040 RepID=A0AAV5TTX2_9BILA|nr:hypothetical protein PENTCL1PPCAC_19881 [Pristionchus entomophagus]